MDMDKEKELYSRVDEYIDTHFVPQDEVLLHTLQSLSEAGLPKISISPNQGKLLHLLALLSRARTILEIGTLAGYSAIWLARALPHDGRLITIEHDPRHASIAQENLARAGLADKVDIRVGRALDVLPQLEAAQAGPFDMIFIDADKPPYAEYLEWALRLASPGALLVADNVIKKGQVLDLNSSDQNVTGIQRFNEALANNPAVSATIVQTVGVKGYDGMALALVKR
jgi:caffeoyl-CoA O-methyltransferase